MPFLGDSVLYLPAGAALAMGAWALARAVLGDRWFPLPGGLGGRTRLQGVVGSIAGIAMGFGIIYSVGEFEAGMTMDSLMVVIGMLATIGSMWLKGWRERRGGD
jgi:hypothetical protein